MTVQESLDFLKEHKEEFSEHYIVDGPVCDVKLGLNDFLNFPLAYSMSKTVYYVREDNKFLHDVFNVISERPSTVIFFDNMKIEDIKAMLEKYEDVISPNTKFTFNNCRFKESKYQRLTKEQLLMTLDRVKEIADYVNHFNLSPFEKIVFLYDLIKVKEYKVATSSEIYSQNEAKNNSIYEVLFDEYVTCLGYSNIFQAVLTEMGFDIQEHDISERNSKVAHSVTSIAVNDEKYGINGTYIFDITKDNFAKELDGGTGLFADDALNINEYEGLALPQSYVESIIHTIPKSIQERVEAKPLDSIKKKQALYNVRKIQHSIDRDFYPIDIRQGLGEYDILSEQDEVESEVIYSLRQLLREKMKNDGNTEETSLVSEDLQDLLESNPELAEKLDELIAKSKGVSSEEEIVDYTENPVMRR